MATPRKLDDDYALQRALALKYGMSLAEMHDVLRRHARVAIDGPMRWGVCAVEEPKAAEGPPAVTSARRNPNSMTDVEVRQARKRNATGKYTLDALARMHGISASSMHRLLRGETRATAGGPTPISPVVSSGTGPEAARADATNGSVARQGGAAQPPDASPYSGSLIDLAARLRAARAPRGTEPEAAARRP
ncbi:transcriptional regulator [Cellulomonas sp. Leaf395]|uniref:transcriptional regulator n=1 Tax=Cellulomonas sp. Leaf395 TaxID=1736362 RepID=UPI0006F8F8D8|nr:transcriptional regulator [Cellulomonas sp. Leaf395]KQS96982.1 hypothetical protein ASG23_15370 [Cellulomonas sp. Leaf395]